MPNADRIDELMLRWEAARQQGTRLSAEEVCGSTPSCLEEIRERIRAVEEMEAILGMSKTHTTPHAHTRPDHSLPAIPGYAVIRVIDEGGMGVVYEARQDGLGRRVAIKMVSRPRQAAVALARFKAEAEAAARLQHPNFIQVYEVGESGERPYFSMEYVDGGSLAQRLAGKPLDARRAAELAETLAHAIQAAHERGIVHRDLKPPNIMFTAEGVLKIADFGLAKRMDGVADHTQTGEVLGTPSYMAPEQAEGRRKEIGPATDVYALGAVLYEMLTGRPPFKGGTPLESLRQVTTHEPTPPSALSPAVPRDLEAICLKCLEKAPARRYASARELAKDLRRFLDGLPVLASPGGVVRRTWKWLRRRPRGVAVGVIVLAAAALLLWSLFTPIREERRRRQLAEKQAPFAREILKRNCYMCHGEDPETTQKDLDVLDHALLLSSERRLVVPGSPKASRLLLRIEDGSMPPEEDEEHLPRLTQHEVDILEQWILGGAPPFPEEDQLVPPVVVSSALAREAKEIFIAHCYQCHRSADAKGGIRILHHRLLLSLRKVVIPYRPDESELFQLLTTKDMKRRMPPPAEALPLSPQEVDVIRRWIAEGALPFPKTEPVPRPQ